MDSSKKSSQSGKRGAKDSSSSSKDSSSSSKDSSSSSKDSSSSSSSDGALTCYLHDLSPVKRARNSSVGYYNFTVQTDETVHRGVSFRMDLRDKIEKAAESKSPVKLVNYKRKANWKDNSLQDIEVNRNTRLEECKAGFAHKNIKKDVAKRQKIKTVLDSGYDKQMVTIIGYIDIDNVAISTMDSSAKRTDTFVNDDSGIVLVSFWNEIANQLSTSGTYELQNLSVRELNSTPVETVLTTTSESLILPWTKGNAIKQSSPPYQLKKSLHFPIKSVSISQKVYKCPRCFTQIEESTLGQDFFRCAKCKNSTKFSSLSSNVTIQLITNEGQEVVMYSTQLNQYLLAKRESVEVDDEDQVCKVLLLDEKSVISVNHRNVVIDF
ncbi:uncharacterized protein LOC130614240 [Hydractinia symbiolongicarpus]|uniref:uncharacterized protein LOC130614240 n=1 Tax=Hydractinia symbiolongicarpus TaxID=13093 RepID=UPI00254BB7F1|nr:uncharacterized protein LOC130614240 [Hydractinia symbiolongicarpus]